MLEIDQLVRTYGPVRALDTMTFTVRLGTVTGFLGPNGAGKTTTMRAIFGLTALDSGEVRWDGHPVDADDRRRFGYLPEERGLYANMRIGEQLRYLGQLRGLTKADATTRSAEWLERLGLADRTRDNLEDLSLGNQQRVQLISALVHEPDVLVLDEPFSGLDPVAVDALSKVLVSEAHRGATVLFSSHQLDLVEHLCEDAVIVDRGKAVAQGPLDDLTAGHDPVLLIDVPNDRDATWTSTLDPARFTVLSSANGAVRLGVADGGEPVIERAQPALDAARAVGAINRFGFERRTLAEVFLEIVGRPADQVDDDTEDDLSTAGAGAHR
ncbi:MAG: ATP-binding cassette domain-containing protein [Actinomycetota bacterium]|nr:ATP-binding cassette domain-containing protein [Actinomycetota bacterium]